MITVSCIVYSPQILLVYSGVSLSLTSLGFLGSNDIYFFVIKLLQSIFKERKKDLRSSKFRKISSPYQSIQLRLLLRKATEWLLHTSYVENDISTQVIQKNRRMLFDTAQVGKLDLCKTQIYFSFMVSKISSAWSTGHFLLFFSVLQKYKGKPYYICDFSSTF